MIKQNFFEKAHKDGDVHPKDPNYVWVSSANKGKGDWRKKGGKAQQNSGNQPQSTSSQDGSQSQSQNKPQQAQKKLEDMSHEELVAFAKQTISETLAKVAANKNLPKPARQVAFDELKTRDDFDISDVKASDLTGAPGGKKEAKVQYNKKPNVDITIPEKIIVPKKAGGTSKVDASKQRQAMERLDDDNLLKILNNAKGNPHLRHLAYEEAASRGIDESKIDTKGSLEKLWNDTDDRQKKLNAPKSTDGDEESEDYYDTSDPMNFDPEKAEEIMKEFPDGDDGWKNPKDPRIAKAFNNFVSLSSRKAYDRFLDYQKRLDPDYQPPSSVIEDLNTDYLSFMVSDVSPLFISAGGAGAGKTYGFKKMAEELNMPRLGEGQNPTDEDWAYVNLTNPASEKDFRTMLKKYNGTYLDPVDGEEHGHILVFDDNDKIITSKEFQALMKNLADTDPEMRTFKDPDTGDMIKFTGKIMVVTNKSMDSLTENEDGKAIMSRAEKSDIHFTVKENLELLEQRYKDMPIEGLNIPASKQQSIRQEVFDFIKQNADKLDPSKFTPRKFGEVIKEVHKDINKQNYAARSATIAKLTGASNANKTWQKKAMNILNKADEDELNDNNDSANKDKDKKNNPAVKKRMELIKKRNPQLYEKLWGKKVLDFFGGSDEDSDDEEDSAEKGMQDEMSLTEAENLLLG